MPGRELRYAILIGVLVAGAGLYALVGDAPRSDGQRWPATEAMFAVDGWTASEQHVEHFNGATFVTRVLHATDERTAQLTIITSQNAKLFEAGAEVPFLGSGYQVAPAPTSIAPTLPGRDVLIAQRGTDQWLVVYGYGERRGLLGNGPVAWGMSVFDGLMGRPNDYYKLMLMTNLDGLNPPGERASVDLADTLFPRIVAWYAAPPA